MSILKNFYPYAFDLDFFGDDHDQFLAGVIEQINQIDSRHVVILFYYEPGPISQSLAAIQQITLVCKHKIILIIDHVRHNRQDNQSIIDTGVDIRFLEFDLLNLHFETNVYQTSEFNQDWNFAAGKFLFLTGKPNHSNRLRLLYKFYQQGLLNQCTWSLFISDDLKVASRKLLSELTDQEYHNFVDSHAKNPDDINIVYGSGRSSHYDGYPFDKQLYEQTAFRVISETKLSERPVVTEKTWSTIANRQPFIIVGNAHNLAYLKSLGYKTFENYLKIKDYDNIIDDEARLDAVVENTKHWLQTIADQKEQISADVEHNYQLMLSYMNKTVKEFESIYRELNTTDYEIFRIIPTSMQRANWINFYYGVKDPSWPDCFSEKEFYSLPHQIQKECVEVHGFKPTN